MNSIDVSALRQQRRKMLDEFEGKTEEEIAREYERRAAGLKKARKAAAAGDSVETNVINHRRHLPTVRDPRLFLVKCKVCVSVV